MRKLIEKFISVTLTISFALSVLGANAIAENTVHTISAVGTTRIEGESASEVFGGGYKRNMLNDGSRKALTYSPIVPTAGTEYYAEYLVNVELAGDYNVNTVASIRSQSYTTDWTIYANTPDNEATGYVQGANVTTDWFPNIFKEYRCGTIYLNEGINTIYWKVNVADAPDNKLQAAIDYIELTSPQEPDTPDIPDVPDTPDVPDVPDVPNVPDLPDEPDSQDKIEVSAIEATRIDGENYTDTTVVPNIRTMNDPDDGQKAVNYVSFNPLNYSGKKFIIEFKLNVENEGDYKLTAVGSQRGQTFTSDWKIYVDTEENAVASYTQVADVTTTKFLPNLFKEFDCGMIHLNQGVNTIYWQVDEADAPNGILQAALDYFTLLPAVVVENPTLKLDGKLKKGDSTEISVVNGDGTILGLGLFSNVTFSSEDERVLIWKDNKVFAANYGKTKATITMKDMRGTLHTFTQEVFVGSADGIMISGATVGENGDVNVEISAFDDYAGGDKLLVAVYDTVDGMLTSIVSASESAVIPNIAKDSIETVTLSCAGISPEQTVAVFMLSSNDDNTAVYSKYIITNTEGGTL